MWAVFVDFDGTITDRDTFDVLVPIFASHAVWEETERGLDSGAMSLRDVLAQQTSFVRGTHAEVAALLRREVKVDPDFEIFARACDEAGVPLTIVSSGIESIIRDRLEAVGLERLPVFANSVEANPDGWIMHFRDPVANGTDKAALISAATARGERCAFVGDGRSDFAAAQLATLRFAKRGLPLERYLLESGLAFEPYDTFADLHRRFKAHGILT